MPKFSEQMGAAATKKELERLLKEAKSGAQSGALKTSPAELKMFEEKLRPKSGAAISKQEMERVKKKIIQLLKIKRKKKDG